MAIVKPFVCVHPAEGYFKEVAALPYDVYSRAEAKAFVADKPYSSYRTNRTCMQTVYAKKQPPC